MTRYRVHPPHGGKEILSGGPEAHVRQRLFLVRQAYVAAEWLSGVGV